MTKIAMCNRCHGFIITNNEPCKTCGLVDNSFCSSCHNYNHRYNTALRYGLTERELKRYG